MAKYILTVNSGQRFKNAWNDDQKDFWVAHEPTLDSPISISDADFEKVIRETVELEIVDGAAVITDSTLGDDTVTLADIKNGLHQFITDLEGHINGNVGVPSSLSQDLTDLKTLQTAVDNGTAGLTFDGEGKTAAFGWVDALYRASNTVPAYTFI